jgi:hypothetical protein
MLNDQTTKGIEAAPVVSQQEGNLDQDAACSILRIQIDYLDSLLTGSRPRVDLMQLHILLNTVSLFLDSKIHRIQSEGYTRLLNRLIKIYTRGLLENENPAFAATAAQYAKVVGIISHQFPGYDYSVAISQLLQYMNLLYTHRQSSWQIILKHLLSMPDNIDDIQRLKEKHLEQIQIWVEEGVNNLFQLRDEQLSQQADGRTALESLRHSIMDKKGQLDAYRGDIVLPISLAKEREEYRSMLQKQESLHQDLESKQRLVELLDENITELGDKLAATRRDFMIHLL